MNLFVLQEVANLFKTYKKISHILRINDNLIKLILDKQIFYIDLNKGKSNIFCNDSYNFATKFYKAPFDFALQKYCFKADIIDCNIDGNNRILRLYLTKSLQYKVLNVILILEFTGKYTNAIIVDSNFIILESLRKITQNSRIIKNGIKLSPLPQQNYKPKEIKLESNILDFLYISHKLKLEQNLKETKIIAIDSINLKIQKLQALLNTLANRDDLINRANNYVRIGELLQNNKESKIINNKIELQDYNGDVLIFNVFDDINPNKSLINEFFTKAKKLMAKATNISIQIQNISQNIAFLESKISFINNTKNLSDIKIITQKNKHSFKDTIKAKYESYFIENIKVSIGKNKLENIALLKDAKADDIWMHIRDIPSSHLIIHSSKNIPKDDIIYKAGEILVGLLKINSGNFLVDYTKRKFVKIKEGANVVYSNYSTLYIKK
ncbi:NFACT family protein [Helicobacter sp. MIT 14-3879]|uniref:NFACT family protein n=1 Tax=Helicobacter sp. MIT 14-3879 TaxID=2040649 RepID=UPI000E1EF1A4|nr:NFACT family protein [Helicobacter sp. MIT 14-3879]RDU64153.1 hypothetical protein CQA44_04305 [Helicobacter sp. MIT 14-3879]